MEVKHVRLLIVGLHCHAQEFMKEYNLEYEQAIPKIDGDCWDFINVKGSKADFQKALDYKKKEFNFKNFKIKQY